MDHHRRMRGVVLADVFELETLGGVVVELDRAELPRPPDRIHDVEVDLRAVESTVARFELVLVARALERGLQRRLGAIPQLVRADARLRTRRELDLCREAEGLVVAENELQQKGDFTRDLVLADEDVAVVLLE